MEYLDLIMINIIEYLRSIIECLRSIIDKPLNLEFSLFPSVLGILLYMISSEYVISSELWSSFKKWARRIGIFFASFGLGSIMMAVLFGMDMQFNFFEEISSPWSKTAANKYLKESWRESYMTKVALPKPLMGGNQQKPVRETLPPEGSSKGKWYDVREWQGTGPKQTETFQIPSSSWMIDWNTLPRGGSPALFSIKVYSADGKFIGSAEKAGGKGIDRAFMNNSGDYYLVIETNQKYSVSVRAQQK